MAVLDEDESDGIESPLQYVRLALLTHNVLEYTDEDCYEAVVKWAEAVYQLASDRGKLDSFLGELDGVAQRLTTLDRPAHEHLEWLLSTTRRCASIPHLEDSYDAEPEDHALLISEHIRSLSIQELERYKRHMSVFGNLCRRTPTITRVLEAWLELYSTILDLKQAAHDQN